MVRLVMFALVQRETAQRNSCPRLFDGIPLHDNVAYDGGMREEDEDSRWKLYRRALDILDGCAKGHALPILQKLVVRQFPPAMNLLSDYISDAEALALLRRAARRGDPTAAYNLAITHRNRGDMGRYRLALAQAARLDSDAAVELRGFKTRFPHTIMRRWRRLAPERS
jgi:hypothetical protein